MVPLSIFTILLCVGVHSVVTLTEIEELQNRVQDLETSLGVINRQMIMQQFYVEEQTRSNTNSGIKRVRNFKQGAQSYNVHSISGTSLSHNHANNKRTIGLGEFVAVLNGVEFRTRHNDYGLYKKHNTSDRWDARQEIEYPPVPPEVEQLSDVDDQITEMREWFKAWADQDYTVRDYRDYFKPVLCYLEGGWTNSEQSTIEESFESDRHFLDATTWLELQEKARFTSYSGTKDGLENYAYLPTTVMSVVNDTIPFLAQWNYEILCHPLQNDLPLNRLYPAEDLKERIDLGVSFEEYIKSRVVRYELPIKDLDKWTEGSTKYTFLDDLMAEIPGKDNYQGNIVDDLMGDTAYPYNTDNDDPLNVAYYHRVYRVKKAGATGLNLRRRGFADAFLFLAQNTQPKSAGLSIEKCDKVTNLCKSWDQRWSYAVPLEIIYLTPLSNWNPYNLEYKGKHLSDEGRTVYKDSDGGTRDGSESEDKCYNGTNSKIYYRTPVEFFEGGEVGTAPADTTKSAVCVLDPDENMHLVVASGHRVHLPEIPGIVGALRQRYFIMPVADKGSGVWKELDALRDMEMNPTKYSFMYSEEHYTVASNNGSGSSGSGNNTTIQLIHLVTGESSSQTGSHVHTINLDEQQSDDYMNGISVFVDTDTANGHEHYLKIRRTVTAKGVVRHRLKKCDYADECGDGHPDVLTEALD